MGGGRVHKKKGVELHKSHYKSVLRSVDAMGDIKYSIGPDRYLAVSKWEGKTRINLREYTRYEGKDTLYPTKKGISLTLENWMDLKMSFDDIKRALKDLADNKTYKTHIGYQTVVVTRKRGEGSSIKEGHQTDP